MYSVSLRSSLLPSLIFISYDSLKINFLIRFITTIYFGISPRLYHIAVLYSTKILSPKFCDDVGDGKNVPISSFLYILSHFWTFSSLCELEMMECYDDSNSSSPTLSSQERKNRDHCWNDVENLYIEVKVVQQPRTITFDQQKKKNIVQNPMKFALLSFFVHSFLGLSAGKWSAGVGSFHFITFFNMLFKRNVNSINWTIYIFLHNKSFGLCYYKKFSLSLGTVRMMDDPILDFSAHSKWTSYLCRSFFGVCFCSQKKQKTRTRKSFPNPK